ncbi:MAG: hypothetical protein WKG01_06525 [Kofleriaceae bacterium]
MGDKLMRDGALNIDEQLTGTKGNCKFLMQGDGNIVIYRLSHSGSWSSIWSPNCENRGGVRLSLQNDGNLVVYTAEDKSIWASNTDGKAVEDLVMQDDENLVMYGFDRKPVWSSNTYNPHPYDPGPCASLKAELARLEAGGEPHGHPGKPPPSREAEMARLARLIEAKKC